VKKLVGLAGLTSPPGGAAVTVGTFDGVHAGHRALIARTVERARELGAVAAAVTWDRHPNTVLRPEHAPCLLTSLERKLELLDDCGIEVAAVLPFTRELSLWPPERFAADVLAGGLGAKAVVVGRGWRFGHRATGDVALLERLGRTLGFDVDAPELTSVGGETASSSRARAAVAAGDMEAARAVLGRPFDFDGIVSRGAARGVGLGFPTANVPPAEGLCRPLRGVYAGRARPDEGRWHRAAVNVGVNPTFGGDPATSPVQIEAYLIDFDGDLYGKPLRVEFWTRLRDERKFNSVDDLVAQMGRDVAAARTLTC
jgi:riboflavin kinase / FMN adenylyltransferase